MFAKRIPDELGIQHRRMLYFEKDVADSNMLDGFTSARFKSRFDAANNTVHVVASFKKLAGEKI